MLFLLVGCVTVLPAESPADNDAAADVEDADETIPRPPGTLSAERFLVTREATTYLGTPYASPANVPATFDCSAFVSHVYARAGYSLPRSSSMYRNVGTRIPWEDAQPGDILVFSRSRGSNVINHLAILWKKSDSGALAGSWIIHAISVSSRTAMKYGNPATATGIVITELGLTVNGVVENEYFYQRFMFCTRVLEE